MSAEPNSLDAAFTKDVQPFLTQHCVRCHNVDEMTSGVRVDHLDATLEDRSLKLWEHVLKQVRTGAMPPEDEPQPAPAERDAAVALAFGADVTRSVDFMLNREDGMGISDTFPIKLGLGHTHHNLSHAGDRAGQLAFAMYDRFLSEQLAHFFGRLTQYRDRNGSVLDNAIVLYGSGASTTHYPKNLPTLVAGGANMGLKHGVYWRQDDARLSNMYLSILRAMQIEQESFADSTGTLNSSVFAGV